MSSISYNLIDYFPNGLIISDFHAAMLLDPLLQNCVFTGFAKRHGELYIYAVNVFTSSEISSINSIIAKHTYVEPVTSIHDFTIDQFGIKSYNEQIYSAYDFVIPVSSKVGFSPPRTFMLEKVKATLLTPQLNGENILIDIKVNDVSILSSYISLSNNTKTSLYYDIQTDFIYINDYDDIVIEVINISAESSATGMHIMFIGKC